MKLRKKRCIAILLFLLGICFIASSIAYTILSSPMDRKDNQEIEVIIPNGMTNINVGKVLASKGLIRNTMFFRIFLYYGYFSRRKKYERVWRYFGKKYKN